jgi:hypothetical protein
MPLQWLDDSLEASATEKLQMDALLGMAVVSTIPTRSSATWTPIAAAR